jgi:hypothetical protein
MTKLPINKDKMGQLLEFLNSTGWSDEERETRLAEALCAYYLKSTRGDVQKTWMLEMTVMGLRKKVEIVATPERPSMLKNAKDPAADGN